MSLCFLCQRAHHCYWMKTCLVISLPPLDGDSNGLSVRQPHQRKPHNDCNDRDLERMNLNFLSQPNVLWQPDPLQLFRSLKCHDQLAGHGVTEAMEGEPGSFVEEGVKGVTAVSPDGDSSLLSSERFGSGGATYEGSRDYVTRLVMLEHRLKASHSLLSRFLTRFSIRVSILSLRKLKCRQALCVNLFETFVCKVTQNGDLPMFPSLLLLLKAAASGNWFTKNVFWDEMKSLIGKSTRVVINDNDEFGRVVSFKMDIEGVHDDRKAENTVLNITYNNIMVEYNVENMSLNYLRLWGQKPYAVVSGTHALHSATKRHVNYGGRQCVNLASLPTTGFAIADTLEFSVGEFHRGVAFKTK
ncbi:hypothetical protein C0J52_24917 [Blattella germanica]|nr:hypothetical protein C0J52_24917 [Blattella germanica]